jgi:hypothetical protein
VLSLDPCSKFWGRGVVTAGKMEDSELATDDANKVQI